VYVSAGASTVGLQQRTSAVPLLACRSSALLADLSLQQWYRYLIMAAAASTVSAAAAAAPDKPPFHLPPLNYAAASAAKQALGISMHGCVTLGRSLCCQLCNETFCEASCPLLTQNQQQQALYEYIVLHEPVPERLQACEEDLPDEQVRQIGGRKVEVGVKWVQNWALCRRCPARASTRALPGGGGSTPSHE
jgi:hypothetical protein